MASEIINLAGTEEDSITNGPGLRFVVFVQGCPHHCPGCHNPQTHEFGKGEDCTVDGIFNRIRSNPLTRGVTFSGGEPFHQAKALAELGTRLKEAGLELAIYSGYTFEELYANPDDGVQKLLRTADILVDGRFVQDLRSLEIRFRGSANQRIIDLPASMTAGKAVVSNSVRWNK